MRFVKKISSLKAHSSIAVTGKVKSSEKAPGGFEIIPTEMRVFSQVEKIPPFEPTVKNCKKILKPDLKYDLLIFDVMSYNIFSRLEV